MSALTEFVVDLFVFGLIATAVTAPVAILGLREGLHDTVRRFLTAAAVVALGCALLSWGSNALVDRCLDAGNTGCLDYGAMGMQVLVLSGYGLVSVLRSVSIWRNERS